LPLLLRSNDSRFTTPGSRLTTHDSQLTNHDIKGIDNQDIDIDTIAEYLNVFERLFILDNQLPFLPNIRSSVRVKQSEKRHFADPSLACAVLGASSSMLMNDLQTYGLLFESLCERDLKLLRICESVKNQQGTAPTALGVICGMSNASYKRPDGVYVLTITALKN